MAASSDFDVIEREREREGGGGDRERVRERERGRGEREGREEEKERERADTSSITFSNGGYTVMSDESIFGVPSGEGGDSPKAPGRRGVLPWSG